MSKFLEHSRSIGVFTFALSISLFLIVSCKEKVITDRQDALSAIAERGEHLQDEYLTITFLNDLKRGQFRLISTEEILQKIAEPEDNYVIIDARAQRAYKGKHIKNAINIPTPITNEAEVPGVEEKAIFQAAIEAFATNYNNAFIPIIVYADTLIDKRGNDLAIALLNRGYRIVYRYVGGYQAWKESGYPTE